MLAHGADAFAEEIAAVGSRHEPSRPDPALDVIAATEWPDTSSCDVVVIGSGAGGRLRGPRPGPGRLRHRDRRGRRALDRRAVRAGAPARALRAHLPRRRRDHGLGTAIPLPARAGVGGTTVVNSGTCYRPPPTSRAPGATARARPRRRALGPRLDDVEATLGVAPAPSTSSAATACLPSPGADALGWARRRCAATPPAARAPASARRLPQRRQARRPALRAAPCLRRRRPDRHRACGSTRVPTGGGRVTGGGGRPRPDGDDVEISEPAGGRRGGRPSVAAAAAALRPRRPSPARPQPLPPPRDQHRRPLRRAGTALEGVLQSVGVEELHERDGILIEATSTPPGMGAVSSSRRRRPAAGPAGAAATRHARRDDRRPPLRAGCWARAGHWSPTALPTRRAGLVSAVEAMAAGCCSPPAPAMCPASPRRRPRRRRSRRRRAPRRAACTWPPSTRPGPPPGRRPGGIPSTPKGGSAVSRRLGRRRLDPAQLPGGQPPGLDHGDGDRGRRGGRDKWAVTLFPSIACGESVYGRASWLFEDLELPFRRRRVDVLPCGPPAP